MPRHPDGTRLRLYRDQLPDQRVEKRAQFRGFVQGLGQYSRFKARGLTLSEQDIAEVDSKHHLLMQCVDVVLGSIPFRLNDKHLQQAHGKHRRGKRTIAKEKLYKIIRSEICRVTGKANFNIGITTGPSSHTPRWGDAYRHWKFVPKESRYDDRHEK